MGINESSGEEMINAQMSAEGHSNFSATRHAVHAEIQGLVQSFIFKNSPVALWRVREAIVACGDILEGIPDHRAPQVRHIAEVLYGILDEEGMRRHIKEDMKSRMPPAPSAPVVADDIVLSSDAEQFICNIKGAITLLKKLWQSPLQRHSVARLKTSAGALRLVSEGCRGKHAPTPLIDLYEEVVGIHNKLVNVNDDDSIGLARITAAEACEGDEFSRLVKCKALAEAVIIKIREGEYPTKLFQLKDPNLPEGETP